MEGWIKLHRRMLNWEWYEDVGTRLVFLHLLIIANYEDKKWRGITIKRGQALASLSKLSRATGLSIQQARNKLTALKTTGEVTSQSTNRYTIYTIQNYNDYQTNNKPTNIQTTSQPTTTKEVKNLKEDKNIPKGIQTVGYGNPDINETLAYMKTKLGLPILDDSEKTNRQYAHLAIKKYGGVDKVKLLIDATAQHDFWATRMASMKQLYYKGVQIISSLRDTKHTVTKL